MTKVTKSQLDKNIREAKKEVGDAEKEVARIGDALKAKPDDAQLKADLETANNMKAEAVSALEAAQEARAEAEKPAETSEIKPKKPAKSTNDDATFKIVSKQEGFRRAGIAHSTNETTHKVSDFTDDQLKALENEPMLIITKD